MAGAFTMTEKQIEALMASEAMRKVLTEVAVRVSESTSKRAAEAAVLETLTKLGIDHTDPLEMQADFRWVRDFRRSSTDLRSKSILILLGILITGSVAAFWIGLKWEITQFLAK
jgi:hypothetical protein